MDVMQVIGLDLHDSSKMIVWNGNQVPIKPQDYFDDAQLHKSLANAMNDCSFDTINVFFPLETSSEGYKSKTIHCSLYKPVNVHDVAMQQKHLSGVQHSDLEHVLSRQKKLCSGQLECFPHFKVHSELNTDVIPSRTRPCPVPRHHKTVFKEECNQLCEIGVYHDVVPLHGYHHHVISLKRMVEYNGFLIFASSMSLSKSITSS
jgi:hypothetical protein